MLAFASLFISVIDAKSGYRYELVKGTSKSSVVAQLAQQGVIEHPYLFSVYTSLHPREQLKAGEYQFPQGSSPVSIWRQLTTGRGLVYHRFMIVPGWTFHQVRAQLNQTEALVHQTAPLTDAAVMSLLGQPALSPEGQFFPETYYFTKGTADIVLLKRAFNLMQYRFNALWAHRAPGLPYRNPYDALIVASLVEKEAYLNSERPIIAGVIMNRLRSGMILQIDSTIIFGLGERYRGTIYKADLLEDTPYNTYRRKGLTPTPIAMPGWVSLQAAMHPAVHAFYYFVVKDKGSHQFSKTLAAHYVAVSARKQMRSAPYFNETKVYAYLNIIFNGRKS